jgi:hypothetical protein
VRALLALLAVLPTALAAQPPVRGDSARRAQEPADTVLRSPGPRGQPRDSAPPAPRTADPVARLLGAMPARNLGPAVFAGRVTALAVPRPYRRTMYVGAAGGGVWKTSNGGTTWRAVADSIGTTTVGDLAVAPSDTGVVWVGTGEKNSLRSQGWGNGVWRSADGGRTWTHAGLTETRTIGRVVIHPRDPNTVWVAALGHLWGPNRERGVYKTTDGGRTWRQTLFVNDTAGVVDLTMDPSNPDVLYAAGSAPAAPRRHAHPGRRCRQRDLEDYRRRAHVDAPHRRGAPQRPPADRMGRIGLAVSAKSPRTVYAISRWTAAVTSAAVARRRRLQEHRRRRDVGGRCTTCRPSRTTSTTTCGDPSRRRAPAG